ncbi:MAG: DUF11 domain-containing protein [Blastocatellia bacterium]
MAGSSSDFSCLRRLAFDLLLGAFLLGLFLIVWLPPGDAAGPPPGEASPAPSGVTALQGTGIIATINGAISASDPTFTGQRHSRLGVPSDRFCQPTGVVGARFYDQFFFHNTSPLPQRVSVTFHSGCGFNTYMAAYSPQFDPTNICANFLASAGNSGDISWQFNVCGNSQFSLVVYGLEPGVTCSSYQIQVAGTSAIVFDGPFTGGINQPAGDGEVGQFTRADQTPKQLRRAIRRNRKAARSADAPLMTFGSQALLPEQGTPLVATVSDSIDFTEPSFTGPRHVNGFGLDCLTTRPIGTRFYDEYFFMNNSPLNQRVFVSFINSCPGALFMAAYSPQFDPTDLCANYLGGAAGFGTVNLEFTVCHNAPFSIIVYNIQPGQSCPGYTYQVFGNEISFVGTMADLAVAKTGPSGPVAVGSDITYLITLSNNGPQRANNVLLTDMLPPGTTFESLMLLTSYGTAFTPPVCTTPPVGSTGTVSCTTMFLPAVPGTGIPNSLQFALMLHVTPGAGFNLSNTATVSHQGIDPNTANNSATATTSVTSGSDFCVQDEANGNILRFNLMTGAYQFINCRKGISLTGAGRVQNSGCKVELSDAGPDPKRPDRSVSASVNSCTRQGSATIKILASGLTFVIQDNDLTNNTCSCP